MFRSKKYYLFGKVLITKKKKRKKISRGLISPRFGEVFTDPLPLSSCTTAAKLVVAVSTLSCDALK